MGRSITMATTVEQVKKKEKIYKDKYLTITLRYKEDINDNSATNVLKISSTIANAIWKYNQNTISTESKFDLFGIYMDYDDIDIDSQNQINKDTKTNLKHDKEKK